MTMKPKVGFVGVGRMGSNMARRLHDLGYPVAAIYDAHADLGKSGAKELGAEAVTSLARVTALADVIFTVVTDDQAMRAIFEFSGDNLFMGATGKLFLNCATVSPSVHLRVEELSRAVSADVLETCMASSIPQARDGTLYLMCAGRREVYTRAEPLLLDISKARAYTGPTGTASKLKALVNMVMNINTAGLAEGLGLAEALGLDLDTVLEVFSQTGAASRVLVTDGADMVKREHDAFFSAAHAAKDSGIALALGREQQLELPLAAATKGQYDRMVALGLGELDKSGVAEITFKSRRAG
jgi:3-hydroxyisobutyrate dehydrogenase